MLQKIAFLPGFNKQVTPTGAESQWTGGENVRFRYGTPEKIGGWKQLGESKLTGVGRALHHMVNTASQKFAIIGTNRILYAYTGGVYYDIHPLVNPSGTAISNAFSTTNLLQGIFVYLVTQQHLVLLLILIIHLLLFVTKNLWLQKLLMLIVLKLL